MHKGMGEKYYAADLFDGTRWQRRVTLEVDAEGSLSSIRPKTRAPEDAEVLSGPVVPGMPNLHSHAFQRAMAGLAEIRGPSEDDCWSWREAMYRLAARLDPEALEAVAAQAFVEMLTAGYTSVCEFHYLHRDPDGAHYADRAELGKRILAAAAASGIGITLLPVLYQHGGFDRRELTRRQRRFYLSSEEFIDLTVRIAAATEADPNQAWGFAFHSLRAVAPEVLSEVRAALDPAVPVHIHVAEQQAEVTECVAHLGRRPVAWLTRNVELGPGWTLIHATHMDADETEAVARSGAVVGLCPTTEANLGDGLFPLEAYLSAGGVFGIGSDSQVSISPIEELRWLEYGRRLVSGRRNTVASAADPRCGTGLWRRSLVGGARATGRPIGQMTAGARADWLVIDPQAAQMVSLEADAILDLLVFSGNRCPVRDVMVGGRWRVRDGHHPGAEAVRRRFLETTRRLNERR